MYRSSWLGRSELGWHLVESIKGGWLLCYWLAILLCTPISLQPFSIVYKSFVLAQLIHSKYNKNAFILNDHRVVAKSTPLILRFTLGHSWLTNIFLLGKLKTILHLSMDIGRWCKNNIHNLLGAFHSHVIDPSSCKVLRGSCWGRVGLTVGYWTNCQCQGMK
jgi:hypothetical protein